MRISWCKIVVMALMTVILAGAEATAGNSQNADQKRIAFSHPVKPCNVTRRFEGICGQTPFSVSIAWDALHPNGFISLLRANSRNIADSEVAALHSGLLKGRAITEAVIDQCLEDGARVRLGTVIAAAPTERTEYLFFDLSRSGKMSNSRFD